MGPYISFIKYLQDNYKDKIEAYVERVLNKKGKEILELSEGNIYGFKCFNIEILDYKFTKSELDIVEFDVSFATEISFS